MYLFCNARVVRASAVVRCWVWNVLWRICPPEFFKADVPDFPLLLLAFFVILAKVLSGQSQDFSDVFCEGLFFCFDLYQGVIHISERSQSSCRMAMCEFLLKPPKSFFGVCSNSLCAEYNWHLDTGILSLYIFATNIYTCTGVRLALRSTKPVSVKAKCAPAVAVMLQHHLLSAYAKLHCSHHCFPSFAWLLDMWYEMELIMFSDR